VYRCYKYAVWNYNRYKRRTGIMAYVAPSISIAGLTLPTYQDILAYLIAKKKEVYGDDIYLGVDSTDYQELSVFALMLYDTLQAVQHAYNGRSPLTAIGTGLDTVVKINGIVRQSSSNSTVGLTIRGVVGITISNGVVQDTSGQNWLLPPSVTIPGGGMISVSATAEATGAIQALAGTVNKIVTLQAGWTSVTNPLAASPGTAVEQDSQLRTRQEISTAIAAITPMDSLMGTVATLSGVTRTIGYENDTDITDINGIPSHSICIVVEGGSTTDIAGAIALKKTLGVGTYGSTTEIVLDYNGNGIAIKFFVVENVEIAVEITIHSLSGYTASVGLAIKEAIASTINTNNIGEDVFVTKIIAAASLWGTAWGNTFTITSVLLGRVWGSPSFMAATDIDIAFNETSVCYTGSSPDDIELVVT
jgi:uncharacterized phage protein gp47/JayE